MDFYSPNLKIAIELDGGHHNRSENKRYDQIRSAYLEKNGIDMIRFWDNDVLRDINSVLEQLSLKVGVTPFNPP